MKLPSNSTSKPRLARFFGWTLLGLIFYATVSAVVFLVSLILLQKQITPDLPWIAQVQEKLYDKGARKIWQAQADCVAFDEQLIYKPKEGSCRFSNVEFNTVLNFSDEGRYTGTKPPGMGIAVVGDSHAMGWGVEDEETFSAVLQRLSGRPVYNLAVSSYGTVRELMRLQKSGLLDKVDTIILQYCGNDLSENMGFTPASAEAARKKFLNITQLPAASLSSTLSYLNKGYWFTFRAPFSGLAKRLFPKQARDFSRHYSPFITAFNPYEALKNKRIIVFYSNAHAAKFRNFPAGHDSQRPYIEFVELNLDPHDYYRIDGHLTIAGHQKVAEQLLDLIRAD